MKLTILAAITVITALIAFGGGGVAQAKGCDVTVTAPAIAGAIQAAVDANPGNVVCLSGTFAGAGPASPSAQTVVFGPEDSGITLRSASAAVLDGTALAGSGPTSINGITLASGVSNVTIEHLEIKNYEGDASGNDRSSAIVAALGNTSNIKVLDSYLHDNFWNGILVFSNGTPVNHTNWKVRDNTVYDSGFVNIELTNCNNCDVKGNTVTASSFAGIVIQARNDTGGSGSVIQTNVRVENNNVSDTERGIYLLAFNVSGTGSALLEKVIVEDNEVDDSSIVGIQVLGFNAASGTGTIDQATVEENKVTNSTSAPIGIRLTDFGSGASGDVTNSKVEDNDVSGFVVDLQEDGTTSTNTYEGNACTTSVPASRC